MVTNLRGLISFANELANESEKIINKYFRTTLIVDAKNDASPVTIADKNTELKIRELIQTSYPNHGILGEEFEGTNIDSEYLWVIDPIDGTRSFIAGHKDFGTLIALLYKNKPVIGIIDCPAHKERWVGVKGMATTVNCKKIKTSSKTSIKDCYAFTSGLYTSCNTTNNTSNTKYRTYSLINLTIYSRLISVPCHCCTFHSHRKSFDSF